MSRPGGRKHAPDHAVISIGDMSVRTQPFEGRVLGVIAPAKTVVFDPSQRYRTACPGSAFRDGQARRDCGG